MSIIQYGHVHRIYVTALNIGNTNRAITMRGGNLWIQYLVDERVWCGLFALLYLWTREISLHNNFYNQRIYQCNWFIQRIDHAHPIHRISFISHDKDDKRTFGYIVGTKEGYKLFALKTQKEVWGDNNSLTCLSLDSKPSFLHFVIFAFCIFAQLSLCWQNKFFLIPCWCHLKEKHDANFEIKIENVV